MKKKKKNKKEKEELPGRNFHSPIFPWIIPQPQVKPHLKLFLGELIIADQLFSPL